MGISANPNNTPHPSNVHFLVRLIASINVIALVQGGAVFEMLDRNFMLGDTQPVFCSTHVPCYHTAPPLAAYLAHIKGRVQYGRYGCACIEGQCQVEMELDGLPTVQSCVYCGLECYSLKIYDILQGDITIPPPPPTTPLEPIDNDINIHIGQFTTAKPEVDQQTSRVHQTNQPIPITDLPFPGENSASSEPVDVIDQSESSTRPTDISEPITAPSVTNTPIIGEGTMGKSSTTSGLEIGVPITDLPFFTVDPGLDDVPTGSESQGFPPGSPGLHVSTHVPSGVPFGQSATEPADVVSDQPTGVTQPTSPTSSTDKSFGQSPSDNKFPEISNNKDSHVEIIENQQSIDQPIDQSSSQQIDNSSILVQTDGTNGDHLSANVDNSSPSVDSAPHTDAPPIDYDELDNIALFGNRG